MKRAGLQYTLISFYGQRYPALNSGSVLFAIIVTTTNKQHYVFIPLFLLDFPSTAILVVIKRSHIWLAQLSEMQDYGAEIPI